MIFLAACTSTQTRSVVHNIGFAQGTTYSIKYLCDADIDYQLAIDSIFSKIDTSLSSYVPYSLISKLNSHEQKVVLDSHFIRVFQCSEKIAQQTNGGLDCTINPLIDLWGFGTSDSLMPDSTTVLEQLQNIGYSKVNIQDSILQMPETFSLNFNALAQGYTVDVIAQFLESNNIVDYLIEVGGELRSSGQNGDRGWWRIGIDKPLKTPDPSDRFQVVLNLANKSLATSGNYRNYYVKDNQIYSHTINPSTGFPVQHNLLSATVVADDCMHADAYATAFMVMGLDSARSFLQKHTELDAFFIYGKGRVWKNWSTPGFQKMIVD